MEKVINDNAPFQLEDCIVDGDWLIPINNNIQGFNIKILNTEKLFLNLLELSIWLHQEIDKNTPLDYGVRVVFPWPEDGDIFYQAIEHAVDQLKDAIIKNVKQQKFNSTDINIIIQIGYEKKNGRRVEGE